MIYGEILNPFTSEDVPGEEDGEKEEAPTGDDTEVKEGENGEADEEGV